MFNKQKQISSLKRTIVFLCCVIFSISCASVFASFLTAKKSNSETNLIDDNSMSIVSCFYIPWSNGQPANTSIVSASGSNTRNYKIYLNEEELTDLSSLTINANTTITATISADWQTLTLDFEGETELELTLRPNPGYEFSQIKLGNHTTVEADANRQESRSGSATTENIDPDYTGLLTFEVSCPEKVYDIQLYYRDGEGAYQAISAGNYSVNNTLTIQDGDSVKFQPEGTTSCSWWFSIESVPSGVTVSYVDDKLTCTGEDLSLVFTVADSETVDENVFYQITNVVGYGDLDAYQNSTSPLVIAKWDRPYTITIENTGLGIDGSINQHLLVWPRCGR